MTGDLFKDIKDKAFKVREEFVKEPASRAALQEFAEQLKEEKEENLALWIFACTESLFFMGEQLEKQRKIIDYLVKEMSKRSKFEDKKSMR